MSEYTKDPSAPLGWRTINHDRGKQRRGTDDAANLNADAMDEGRDEGASDVEPDE